ncbi:MAG: SusD/RagB family nutrient-binding outer membrane lipoprotein [Proteiniphilum sp.]|jgi:hypothetical protein|nr:SusD/RagB family nutrient-binding outer membrane lipoprotein [Proteiniphilum sp.]
MKRYKLTNSIRKAVTYTVAFLFFALTACTDKFDEYNTNPNGVSDLGKDNLEYGFFSAMQLQVFPIGDDSNPYQRMCNLIGDIYSCYLTGTHSWNGDNNGMTYVPYEDWIRVPYEVAFSRFMPNYYKIVALARKDNKPDALALAQILKVFAMHRITDMYGPIPYSRLGGESKATPYDSQETIYKTFFKELEEAVTELNEFVESYGASMKPYKNFDLIYGGDYVKWIRFANTLRLRLAMRIRYADPVTAKKLAEDAIKAPYGVITENADNALLKTTGSTIINHPLKMIWDDYQDTRMSANMESFLVGYKDPRLPVYFQPATSTAANARQYMGVRSGAAYMRVLYNAYRAFSSPNVTVSTPVQWMVAAESWFLRAEGALIGWDMSGTAENLYVEGIKKSFEQRGVSGADAYSQNSTNKPAAVQDIIYFGNSVSASSGLVSTSTVKWNAAASTEESLERIITQKWLALFPDGQEAWSEFRRTAYPKLFPVATNNSGGAVNTLKQIRRIPYPNEEYQNPTAGPEVTKAVAELLGGPDTGGTQLWWDKKK